MTEQGEKRTSKAWYILGAGVTLVVGLAGFGYLLFTGLVGMADGTIRLNVPDIREVELDRPGGYTVFWETPSGEGHPASDDWAAIGGLIVRVEAMNGAAIPVGSPGGSSTYSLHGRKGVSIMAFKIESPGRYRIVTDLARSRPVRPVVLAVVPGFAGRLLRVILTAFGVLGGAVLLCVALLLWAFTRPDRRASAPRMPGLPPPPG